MKCPKCESGEIGRISVNKHSKMRVGFCSACGKLVNLGKADEAAKQPLAGEEKAVAPVNKKEDAGKAAGAGKSKTVASARRGSRRAVRSGAKRPVQPGSDLPAAQPKRGGFGQSLRTFFDWD